ncbi:hypothetical protein KKB40_00740 [Patescibacteria group bacterium]|nr:hypothetical protein [Patescibacteria group bacterium]
MIPTLIRIPEEEHKLYKELASGMGISLAEYIRIAVRKKAKVVPKKKMKHSIFDLGTKIVFSGGPGDGSLNHDKHIYEFEEKKIRRQHR